MKICKYSIPHHIFNLFIHSFISDLRFPISFGGLHSITIMICFEAQTVPDFVPHLHLCLSIIHPSSIHPVIHPSIHPSFIYQSVNQLINHIPIYLTGITSIPPIPIQYHKVFFLFHSFSTFASLFFNSETLVPILLHIITYFFNSLHVTDAPA